MGKYAELLIAKDEIQPDENQSHNYTRITHQVDIWRKIGDNDNKSDVFTDSYIN